MCQEHVASVRRIAVLYSELAGYTSSCLRSVQERHGVELLVIRIPQVADAPFSTHNFAWIGDLYDRSVLSTEEMSTLLKEFRPDGIYMAGWADKGYLRLARSFREQGVPVIAGCDNQWTGALRQWVGSLISPWYLRTAIDVLWVAGERQRQFARRLGYRGERCWDGIYACDWKRFSAVRSRGELPQEGGFLFAGRYVAEKGIETLVEAYRRYKERIEQPWPLICAGSGKRKQLLDTVEGITDKGFVQPDELPALMQRAAAFVLPSHEEPWGVVLQEAAAAGLPLICTEACGAGVHLLRDGYNGYLVETGSAEELATAMLGMSRMDPLRRRKMGDRSHELSKQYTPERWADTLVCGLQRLKETSNASQAVNRD